MKRIFAAVCLLLLVPALAAARSETFTLSALRAQTPAFAEGMIEAYGRTISFHAPVYVPNGDEMPMLRVKRTNVSDEAAEKLGDSLEKNTLYGQRLAERPTAAEKNAASHFTAYVQNLWAEETDAADIFAPNREQSLLDAESFLARKTEAMFGDRQIGCLPYRAGLRSDGDGYYIEAWETLRGISIVTGVERTFTRQGKRGVQQALSNASRIALGEYRSEADYVCAFAAMWRETEAVRADVPLCAWKTIAKALERGIRAGRIRAVYSVTLGYAVYAASDRTYPSGEAAYEAEYLLVPTWFIECKYAESAAKTLVGDASDDLDAPSYHKEKGFKILLIDAQTGEWVDPEDESADRYVYAI